MIYRQRQTVVDDFLLQVVCPWLADLHATRLIPLARIWSEPVFPASSESESAVGGPIKQLWSKIAAWNYASSMRGTYPPVKHEQSSAN